MKVFLHTPIMDISSKSPGQWGLYDDAVIRSAWLENINRHYKFIETYFSDCSKEICASPIREIESADIVNAILLEEQRRAFGTTWNRNYFIVTKDTPKTPIWMPNNAGTLLLKGDIQTLCMIIMCQRFFTAFQEKFPEFLKLQAPSSAWDNKPHFRENQKESEDGIRISYMQISRACPIPFNKTVTDHMKWAIDHLSKGFALQKAGYDLSIKDNINEVINSGFVVNVPAGDIKQPTSLPALLPIVLSYDSSAVNARARYILDIYKEGKFWKRKQGFMVPYGYMEMWYKLFEQMREQNAKNYTITLLYATAPEEEPESVKYPDDLTKK